MDPISPELVLVDPELARAERARLTERALLEEFPRAAPPVDIAPIRHVVESAVAAPAEQPKREPGAREAAGWAKEKIGPVSLAAVAAVAGFLLAARLGRDEPTTRKASGATRVGLIATASLAPRSGSATETASLPPPAATDEVARTGVARPAATTRSAKARLEQRILTLIIRAPGNKLPQRLRDRRTGLLKNNVQAVCRRSGSQSFSCVVRPARHDGREGLYVNYRIRRDGSSFFTWSRYRKGGSRARSG